MSVREGGGGEGGEITPLIIGADASDYVSTNGT